MKRRSVALVVLSIVLGAPSPPPRKARLDPAARDDNGNEEDEVGDRPQRERQTEAARSTGLTRAQTLAYVVVPQAVRNVLPDLIGNTLEVVRLTSLANVVALPEWPGVRLLSRLEHRMIASR